MSRTRQAKPAQTYRTVPQLSQETGIPERTLYDWIARGKLKGYQPIDDGRIWVKRAEFDDMMEASRVPAS